MFTTKTLYKTCYTSTYESLLLTNNDIVNKKYANSLAHQKGSQQKICRDPFEL
ncbi:hypothetical protein LCUFL03_330299 [Latilactobacillus curvatus]|nr:hypothetical protein LCUFL03_330299 [Latilactobacillus curvatus]